MTWLAEVSLVDIRLDTGTQVRATINNMVVADYAERMSAGDVFPPIRLFADGGVVKTVEDGERQSELEAEFWKIVQNAPQLTGA